jgi:tetratricopeptide (TPR) repeat protein
LGSVLIGIPAFGQVEEWWSTMQAGMAADQKGDYAQSMARYREAIAISERLSPTDERRAYSWNAVAKTQDVLGNYASAESAYRRALKAAEATGRGKSSPAYTLPLENLATLYAETGQPTRAERLAREALALVSEFNPPDQVALAMAQSCLATITDMIGKHGEAIRLATAALEVLERHDVAWPQTVATLNTLGTAVFTSGDYTQCERLFLKALATIEKYGGPDHPLVTRVLTNLSALALHAGRREEAGQRLTRALTVAESRLGVQHPMYGTILAWYARYLRETGDKQRAKTLEAQSSQIMRENGRRNGLGSVIDVTALRGK